MRTREHGRRWVPLLLAVVVVGRARCSPTPPPRAEAEANGTTAVEDAHREWDVVRQKLSVLVNGLLDQALPDLTRTVSRLDLSPDCLLSLFRVIGGARRMDLESMRMLDANSKIPSGILEGTVTDLGDYDQCLSVRFRNRFNEDVEDFRGRYCGLALKMPLPPKPEVIAKNTRIIEPEFFPESHVFRELAEKSHNFYHTFFRFGLCLPSHCSREDVEKLVSPVKGLLNMDASVLNCDIHQDSKPLNKDQVVSLIIIGFFVLVILLATAVDALGRMNHNWKCQAYLQAPVTQSFAEMSLLRATRKLLTVKTPRDEHGRNLQVVHGVRTFNVFWIVVAHTYGFAEQTTYRSGLHVINQASSIFFQPVMNSFLCVDSFFFLSGFLLTFNQCKSTWQTGPVLDFFVKLLGRYWRLVPVAALCMTVLFLLPEVASGPIWHEKLDMAIANCHRSWWSVLLNVQNFYPYEQSCQPHYWYISADMQIFPVVLATSILLGRKVKLGLIVKVAILVLSVLLVGTLTYVNSYPPAIVLFGRDIIYSKGLLSEVYFRPYVHIGPYIVGSLVAYMYLKRDKIHISPLLETAGWLICLAGGAYVNMVTIAWADGSFPSNWWSTLYAALHRLLWAVCLGWAVYACAVGRGGILNTILSWKPLVPISRISFTIYVVHIYVLYFKLWTIRERVTPDTFHVFMSAISSFVLATILGFVASIFFEKPIVWLWDTLTRKGRKPREGDDDRAKSSLSTSSTCSNPHGEEEIKKERL